MITMPPSYEVLAISHVLYVAGCQCRSGCSSNDLHCSWLYLTFCMLQDASAGLVAAAMISIVPGCISRSVCCRMPVRVWLQQQ